MLRLRLQRFGQKHQPHFRVVVADGRAPVKGQYLEKIGQYSPQRAIAEIDKEKALKWLNRGATPSNRVARLLKSLGVKHKLIVVKVFKPVTQTELEAQKALEEKERAEREAQRETAKAAWEKESEEKAQAAAQEKVKQEAAEAEEIRGEEAGGEEIGGEEAKRRRGEEKVQKTEQTSTEAPPPSAKAMGGKEPPDKASSEEGKS